MELTNEFVVERPVEETWRILNDLEFIAPCMPGAKLEEIEGDEYRGLVKIKVGPITANYKGKASFVSQDAEAKVAKLKAEGRDPRQGNANAIITASMEPVTDASTAVKIHTDLSLSGKIASFGRGAIEDVSKKLLGQFADNLRDKLDEGGAAAGADADAGASGSGGASASEGAAVAAAAAASTGAAGAGAAAGGAAGSAGAGNNSSTAEGPKVRKIESADPEPVDLLDAAGDTMMKRLAPVLAGLAVLVLLRMILRRGKA